MPDLCGRSGLGPRPVESHVETNEMRSRGVGWSLGEVMSWPIGRGSRKTRYEVRADAAVFANGVRLTDADGWMNVEMRAGAGLPDARVSVRIHYVPDADGAPFFYIEDVTVNGRRYHSVYASIVDGHEQLAVRLAECVHTQILRRISEAEPRSHARLTAVSAARRATGQAS